MIAPLIKVYRHHKLVPTPNTFRPAFFRCLEVQREKVNLLRAQGRPHSEHGSTSPRGWEGRP